MQGTEGAPFPSCVEQALHLLEAMTALPTALPLLANKQRAGLPAIAPAMVLMFRVRCTCFVTC